ncbi:MAG: hypothetical protein IJW62_07005, partial [Clostridia bacterium]|nr:hypothetical protein [Clostridia bacterium]
MAICVRKGGYGIRSYKVGGTIRTKVTDDAMCSHIPRRAGACSRRRRRKQTVCTEGMVGAPPSFAAC